MNTPDPTREKIVEAIAAAERAKESFRAGLELLKQRQKEHSIEPCGDPNCPIVTSCEAILATYDDLMKRYAEKEETLRTKLQIFDDFGNNRIVATLVLQGVLKKELEIEAHLIDSMIILDMLVTNGIEGHA